MSETLARSARFTERVFTERERDYCTRRGAVAAQHFAARWAAKEAFLKALGTGWHDGIAWHDVEVAHRDSGAPYLIVTGKAREISDARFMRKPFHTVQYPAIPTANGTKVNHNGIRLAIVAPLSLHRTRVVEREYDLHTG